MSRNKIKIIPLMLIMIIVFSQCIVCYALPSYDITKYPSDNSSCEYNEKFAFSLNNTQSYQTMSGSSEICGYVDIVYFNDTPYEVVTMCSLNSFSSAVYQHTDDGRGYVREDTGTYYSSEWQVTNGALQRIVHSAYPYNWQGVGQTIEFNSIYIFDSANNAYNYLTTGDMNGLKYNKTKTYDSDNIYLENFRVIYHDSNVLENCYIEVKYDLPEYITDNIEKARLNLTMSYDCDFDMVADLINVNAFDFSANEVYDLKFNPTGFNIYLKDYVSDKDYFNYYSKMMLGDEIYIDFEDLTVGGVGLNSLAQITKSMIYMDFIPEVDGTCGLQNNAQVDLLNPSNTSYYSSTPDNNGNYTSNNDFVQGDGYYTTLVGQDGQGNPTYNYYYYDNSKHYSYEIDPDTDVDIDTDIPIGGGSGGSGDSVVTILWGNALEVEGSIDLNSTVGGGSGGSGGSGGDSNVSVNTGDNIVLTIEDDDYTDSALREDLKDGFGLFDDSETDLKADGYLQLASDFFNNIDPSLGAILCFGISSSVVIGILRTALRR